MNRVCQTLLVLLPAIFVTGCHEQSDSVSLNEIIERNTDAMGGRGAIEAVQSIQIELHIKDPSFEVDGTYYATRPGKMRIDVSAEGKHVFTEAFDGQYGWQWEGKGEQKPATEKATAALRHGVESSETESDCSWHPVTRIAGNNTSRVWQVRCTRDYDGADTQICLDIVAALHGCD